METIVSKALEIKREERQTGKDLKMEQMRTVLEAENILRPSLVQVPHPILRVKAEAVPITRLDELERVRKEIETMTAIMWVFDGQGLGAQQAGYSSRVIVLAVPGWERLVTHMVNPQVLSTSEKMKGFEETCLSLPGKRVYIWRPTMVDVEWYDVHECLCGHSHTNHNEAGRCDMICFGDPEVGDHECPCLGFTPLRRRMRAKDMLARTILHEIDHLDGRLITDYEVTR